jgi:predicted nucleotidyltransferase
MHDSAPDVARWAMAEARRIVLDEIGERDIAVTLFGSRARGTARPFSDIDIALEAKGGPVDLELYASLGERLEESLIPFEVDLVDLASADEGLRRAVSREGVRWKD